MDRRSLLLISGLLTTAGVLPSVGVAATEAVERKVGITENMPFTIIEHRGVPLTVERIQDTENHLTDDFTKTSRPCPPFCIHPMETAPGVRTIGELELIEFIQTEVDAGLGLFIDARISTWYESETIPGAVNIPFVLFTDQPGKRDIILELLGARRDSSGSFDFSGARKLAFFCNGPWCDQSPRAIKSLIKIGYPPDKLLYYRGGMQAWKSFGLTTVVPKRNEVKNHLEPTGFESHGNVM